MLQFVVLCLLWYSSSALTNTSSKTFLNEIKAPVTLTFVQFAFVAAWTALLATLGSRFELQLLGRTPIKKPDAHVWNTTAPMSLFVLSGHLFSAFATSLIPYAYSFHTIKALSPIFTVAAYSLLFNVKYSNNTYIALLPLTIGVMLACSYGFTANLAGLVCALGSTLIFVSQNIFSKKVLFHEKNDEPLRKRLDKYNLLFYSSSMAFLLMFPIWIYYESALIFNSTITAAVCWELTFNGTCHAAQNVLAFSLLSIVSPVTYSIASLVKRIFVIIVAIAWFGQKTNLVQAFGIVLTGVGLYMYDRAKDDVARIERKVERIEAGATLPMVKSELSSRSNSPMPEKKGIYELPANINGHVDMPLRINTGFLVTGQALSPSQLVSPSKGGRRMSITSGVNGPKIQSNRPGVGIMNTSIHEIAVDGNG